ncbi:phytanoyl-CoA dioxygenase family protein [Congregibacter brevis]|uniref:Phytanoyl-CoA dioxygenase family protein n=1 Tax=Congregibacter brevis TaxID=3081201 RepID=A0ABZ0ICY1_9GAMM|nr:phytanoyl-CoA dioxygenase family protein [Congregibacter sp. IMCC45268]
MQQPDYMESINACAAHYGRDAEAMRDFLLAGHASAMQLENRGPIAFDANGKLDQRILSAYKQYGFYVFTNVLHREELMDIEEDLEAMKKRFPTGPGERFAADDSPALGADCSAPTLVWSKPLGDPLGGSALANGRHEVKLHEPQAAPGSPEWAPFILLGSLQFSETCLRVYGHPQLLKIAEEINGKDFAPFNETLFIKEPGIGAAVSWHQDGTTHWDSPTFDEDVHGFNFMVQVYGSTAVNGVWVLPGSHKAGKVDIKGLVKESGSERIKGTVPLVCNAGDVVMCNRQLVHGSFANTGLERRVTVNMGFHRRSSVLNVMGSGTHNEAQIFDETLIAKRSEVIGYGIDARRQRFPSEAPYVYQPFFEQGLSYKWDADAKASLHDYNALDLSI